MGWPTSRGGQVTSHAPVEACPRSQRSDLLGGGASLHQRALAGDGHRWRRERERIKRLGQVRSVDGRLAADDRGAPVHHDHHRPVLTAHPTAVRRKGSWGTIGLVVVDSSACDLEPGRRIQSRHVIEPGEGPNLCS